MQSFIKWFPAHLRQLAGCLQWLLAWPKPWHLKHWLGVSFERWGSTENVCISMVWIFLRSPSVVFGAVRREKVGRFFRVN